MGQPARSSEENLGVQGEFLDVVPSATPVAIDGHVLDGPAGAGTLHGHVYDDGGEDGCSER